MRDYLKNNVIKFNIQFNSLYINGNINILMKNFEKDLVKTPFTIEFEDDNINYPCFYHTSNKKSYYFAGDEYLVIVNPLKVKEITNWYASSKKNKDEEE